MRKNGKPSAALNKKVRRVHKAKRIVKNQNNVRARKRGRSGLNDIFGSQLIKWSKSIKTRINVFGVLFSKLSEKIKFIQNRADPT